MLQPEELADDMHDVITVAKNERSLLSKLADEMERAVSLISSIGDAAYLHSSEHTGAVGEHFRHNLDIVKAFLEGIESGRVDYGKREREPRIEVDRSHAIERYRETIWRARSLSVNVLPTGLSVRSEVDPSVWLPSSVGREVEYVHSHTIHHHALIAEKLSAAGIQLDKNFGVAPSTLEYWAGKKG